MKSRDDLYEQARKNILRGSEDPLEFTSIKGPDMGENVDIKSLVEAYKTTGFQATKLAQAIELIKKMRKEGCFIFLGYTSNMVSSGLRDVFAFLAKNNLVDAIVTTAGGIEEDLIKCIDPFILGEFSADGAKLRESGINRIGNIFVPNERYCKFEDVFIPFLEGCYKEQKESGKIYSPSSMIRELGLRLGNEDSIYYWCAKNSIPVFCPAITDGSMGDMIYFFKYKRHDFLIDVTQDIVHINNLAMDAKKTGIIILGAGLVKHHICNANMFRNGADYAVYINTAQEFDGSDAGARPDEAVSWGKILPGDNTVKVFADATIVFPIIVEAAFKTLD